MKVNQIGTLTETLDAAGLGVALLLWLLIARTRVGMRVRAGASNADMISALGVNIRQILRRHPHLKEQPLFEGRRLSCFYSNPALAGNARRELQDAGYDVLLSAGRFLDVLPRGVQKGPTLLRTVDALGLPRERVLVAGDTLNDLSLFQTGLHGVVVANREPLLAAAVKDFPKVLHSTKEGAAGVLDALQRMH